MLGDNEYLAYDLNTKIGKKVLFGLMEPPETVIDYKTEEEELSVIEIDEQIKRRRNENEKNNRRKHKTNNAGRIRVYLYEENRRGGIDMRGLVILLLVSSSLAGCAEMIPDPPVEGNDPAWVTEYHNFTYEDTNNSTMPVITFGDNGTLVEIFSASAILHNDTVNLTVDMKPFFSVNNVSFQQGHAPTMGEVTLNLIELHGYNYNCTVVYRLWEL